MWTTSASFFKNLFIWNRERVHEWGKEQREREQGALFRAQSQDPELMVWAESRSLTDWATRCPRQLIFYSLCWLFLVLLRVYFYFIISGGTLTLRMLTTILCLAFLLWCKGFSQGSVYQLFAFVFFWIISYSVEIWSYGSLLEFFSDTYLTILFGSLSQPRAIYLFFPIQILHLKTVSIKYLNPGSLWSGDSLAKSF